MSKHNRITLHLRRGDIYCHLTYDKPITTTRIGMVARVLPLESHSKRDHIIVYFEDSTFSGPCYFYLHKPKGWYKSFIPLNEPLILGAPYGKKESTRNQEEYARCSPRSCAIA